MKALSTVAVALAIAGPLTSTVLRQDTGGLTTDVLKGPPYSPYADRA